MVGRWGMSGAVGRMTVLDGDINPAGASLETLALIDAEVRRLSDEAYEDVTELLRTERERLDALAEALLTHETLDADDAFRVVNLERPRTAETHPPLAVQEKRSLDRG
jgi:cell division protease FtsH